MKVLVEGVRRARRSKQLRRPTTPFFLVEVEEVEEQSEKSVELEALVRAVHSVFEAFVKLNKRIPPEMLMQVASIDDPARLADTIVAQPVAQAERQAGAARDRDRRRSGWRSSTS